MPRRAYLSPDERNRFDTPPTLTAEQQLIILDLPPWAETYLKGIKSPTNKVGFVLQLGYFRVVTRFFVSDRFEGEVIDWVSRRLRLDPNGVDLNEYTHSRTSYRHRADILHHLGFDSFGPVHQTALGGEANRLAHLQTRPALLLDALAGYLRERRVEIPSYNTLRLLLNEVLDEYQTHLEQIIEQNLKPVDRAMLDGLLAKQTPSDNSVAGLLRYRLTNLKRINQSMQPKAIRQRVGLFKELKAVFEQLRSLIQGLNLSDDTIRYYAQYVLDTQSKQSSQHSHERYIRLIAFIVHQYLSVGDAFVLTFRQAVTSILNVSEQILKEQLYLSRQATAGLVGQVVRRSDAHIDALSRIETIVDDQRVSDGQKVLQIRELLGRKRVSADELETDRQRLQHLKTVNQPVVDRDDYYNMLEKESLKLQVRVAGIV